MCDSACVVKPSQLESHFTVTHKRPPTTTIAPTFFQDLIKAYELDIATSARPGAVINAIYGLYLKDGLSRVLSLT